MARIVIVEDESIVAEVIKSILKGLGYTVLAIAASGEQAIKEISETHPDLVLMDIVLKGEMDGVEAAEQIRARFNIPVVYLTAYTDEKILQRAKITEPYGYVLKPCGKRELLAAIEIALYKYRIERKLKESEQWLSTTLRSIGDALIATDAKGCIKFMNPVAEALTGWKQEDALDKNLKEVFNIINEETHILTASPVTKALQDGVIVGMENHILIAKDRTEIPIGNSAAPIKDDKENIIGAVLVFKDITERRKTEKALLTSAREWQATFDAVKDCIALLDSKGKILRCNNSLVHLLGRSFSDINGRTFDELMPGELEPITSSFLRLLKSHLRENLILSLGDRWYNIVLDPLLDKTDGLLGGVCIISDISDRKRAEEEEIHTYQEQLRSLASQLSLVEERERHRLATGLHDHIGQPLALCKIKLGALRESASPDLAVSVDGIRDFIDQTIQYTRSLTSELSPPILYEIGFEAAIEWLGEQILSRQDIHFHFNDDGQPKPMEDGAIVLLFQAVRDLLINVTKHSQARNAIVSIRRDGNNIRIKVEDDGVGFDISKLDSYLRTGSFGLFSIRERLNHIRGYLNIESESGKGTRVIIVAPLKLEKHNEGK